MQMERRALFNSLRIHWLLDSNLDVEEWQVLDYRSIPIELIFKTLNHYGFYWDRASFQALAEHYDSPEELANELESEEADDPRINDQIFLLVFELWRRFVPEKMGISIFCDELDHWITLYDAEQLDTLEPIEDALANLQLILEENCDYGAEPKDVFETLASHCANDLESFLYDFISEQIDNRNYSYATELLEGFTSYVHDVKWFDFLGVRLIALKDPEEANLLLQQLLQIHEEESDLEFLFEVLAFLVKDGEHKLFGELVHKSLPLIASEADLQDLLKLCIDYFHYLDKEVQEELFNKLLNERSSDFMEDPIKPNDPAINALKKAF